MEFQQETETYHLPISECPNAHFSPIFMTEVQLGQLVPEAKQKRVPLPQMFFAGITVAKRWGGGEGERDKKAKWQLWTLARGHHSAQEMLPAKHP